jgi:wyosine [tRNA(Phe)-imidazoG37] synthetase (radical SAM superfamily)
MNMIVEAAATSGQAGGPAKSGGVFGYPRDPLRNRFVYVTISPRACGLSIGVNLNPDRACNFDCVYCEVDRRGALPDSPLDLDVMAAELKDTLALITSGRWAEKPPYARVPAGLLRLRHVAISGDGEPTLCPQFCAAVETILHLRATSGGPFFKVVLITNASNLDATLVQDGLRLFTRDDEVWVKLDVGTQSQMDLVNKSEVPLEKILANILCVARRRPVVIQSMFPTLQDRTPDEAEIERYIERLQELNAAGAQISLVQIYSATRPVVNPDCGHLPLRALTRIAQTVRSKTGLNVEFY